MKGLILLTLIILIACQVQAISINFSCPKEAMQNKEFSCFIGINNPESSYDVKLDFSIEGQRVSNFWNGIQWKSTNYYSIGLINNNQLQEIKIIIKNYTGSSLGLLKIRKTNGSIEYQENFSIQINPQILDEELKKNQDEKEENIKKDILEINDTPSDEKEITEKIIKLNQDEKVKETIYISKDEKIRENLLRGFTIFLILVIIVLIAQR